MKPGFFVAKGLNKERLVYISIIISFRFLKLIKTTKTWICKVMFSETFNYLFHPPLLDERNLHHFSCCKYNQPQQIQRKK